ncbi:MAG TPA: OmpA family protein [Stellaceae bacterium]|nr:OmpA family protein [Stellaceae bacterium]
MIRSRSIFIAALLALAACSSPPPPPPAPPPAPPPPIPGPQTMSERTLLTMASDSTFASGSYTLTRAGRAKLNDLLPQLQSGMGPNDKVVVYGYTDDKPVGKALKAKGIEDNLDLSSKRAAAVVRYLTSKGINPAVISAKGRGDTHPVAPNDNAKDRAQNRRIEVVVEQPQG